MFKSVMVVSDFLTTAGNRFIELRLGVIRHCVSRSAEAIPRGSSVIRVGWLAGCLVLAVCVMFVPLSPVWGASDGAVKLRTLNGLSEFTPPETFLNGNFIADEIEPQYIFGKIKDFRKSRSCPTAWLIEDGQRDRIKNQENVSGPFEYTLYLEEDCPGKVVYYVFIDRSQGKGGQWMEWRKVFHKSKTEEEYGAAGAVLEQAAGKGFPVDAELRFVEIRGELILKKNEDFLVGDLKIKPLFDLKQGRAAGK